MSILVRIWRWIEAESKVLTILLSIPLLVFAGLTAWASLTNLEVSRNLSDYIDSANKGEYKIDLGDGNFIGRKLIVVESESGDVYDYRIATYWRMNTEPSEITANNAHRVDILAVPGNDENREKIQETLEGW